jgi:hypothetical protein
MLKANPKDIETKAIATHNPALPQHHPFKIRIPPNKDKSKREAQSATKEIQVYTDGSVIEGKVGAAAILTRPGKDHRTLHLHLGKVSEYTIFDTELAGLSMGIYLIKTENVAHRKTMLGVDNQAAINAVQNELSAPNHHLAADILRSAQ